jgi:hypothetical protein
MVFERTRNLGHHRVTETVTAATPHLDGSCNCTTIWRPPRLRSRPDLSNCRAERLDR